MTPGSIDDRKCGRREIPIGGHLRTQRPTERFSGSVREIFQRQNRDVTETTRASLAQSSADVLQISLPLQQVLRASSQSAEVGKTGVRVGTTQQVVDFRRPVPL